MSKNLATTNKKDFTILKDGEAFISQTKIAELCGTDQSSISRFIKKSQHTLKLNKFNQLDSDSLELTIGYYAFESQRTNVIAQQNYRLLAKAGAKAYIYHQAGYQFDAKPREELLKNKRLAQHTWSDALKIHREKLGKTTKNFHYLNENKMLNRMLFNQPKIEEKELNNDQIELLEEARVLNGSLIKIGMEYKHRKAHLQNWFNNSKKPNLLS